MTEPLGCGEISLAPPYGFFRNLTLRNIQCGAAPGTRISRHGTSQQSGQRIVRNHLRISDITGTIPLLESVERRGSSSFHELSVERNRYLVS